MSRFIREELPKWPDSAGKFACLINAIDLATNWGNEKYLHTNAETLAVYEKIIRKYARSWPEGISSTESIAEDLINSQNYDQAIDLCQKRVTALPDAGNLYAAMGQAVYGKKDSSKALKLLLQATKLGADNGLAYYFVARSAISRNDHKTGKMAALKAAELLPPSSERKKKAYAYTFAARCASATNDYLAAQKYSDLAIKTDPQQAYVWYSRGHLNHKLKDLKAAKTDFIKTLELNPSDKFGINQDFPKWQKW